MVSQQGPVAVVAKLSHSWLTLGPPGRHGLAVVVTESVGEVLRAKS